MFLKAYYASNEQTLLDLAHQVFVESQQSNEC
jgi:hypothetical protein